MMHLSYETIYVIFLIGTLLQNIHKHQDSILHRKTLNSEVKIWKKIKVIQNHNW